MSMGVPLTKTQAKIDNQFLIRILIIQVVGIGLGSGLVPSSALALAGLGLLGLMVYAMVQRRLVDGLQLIAFLQFLQPFLRAESSLPHFYVELCTIIFVLFYLRQFTRFTISELSVVSTFIVFYFMLEVLSYGEYSQFIYYKAILGNSLATTMLIYAASKKTTIQIPIEKIVRILLNAGALLAGIILSAHLMGDIEYSTESNFEASNGMAPNQLSFYLAITSFLLFYKFINESKVTHKLFFVVQLMLVAGLMALTFSRGGMYFLAVYTLVYLFFNRQKITKSNNAVYLTIVFIPMVLYTFNAIVNITDNKITDRYNQEGASNREDLVKFALIIFQENPVVGIGTSAFYKYAAQPRFFGEKTGAHNEFARSLAEHGIIGGILFFGFVISGFLAVKKRRIPLDEKVLYYIFMFSYVAGCLHNGQKIGLQSFMVFLALSPLSDARFSSILPLFTQHKPGVRNLVGANMSPRPVK